MQDNTKVTQKAKAQNLTVLIGLADDQYLTVQGYTPEGVLKYDWRGNSDFHSRLNDSDYVKKFITIIGANEPERTISEPDIVINCIIDADISGISLDKAIEMVELMKKEWPDTPIFNAPANIKKTTRDLIYENYNHLDDITIPKTVRVAPKSPRDVMELAEHHGIQFPFLFRPCGSHQSEDLQKIDNAQQVQDFEKYAFDGREYYLTQFVNNKHDDGTYRKARLIIIDGQLYARHYITNPKWLVEGAAHWEYMPSQQHTKEIEEHFLNNFETIITPEALKTLHHIYDDIGLNYLGFDIDVLPDGSILVFEINVAQNALLDIDMKNFAYMKPSSDAIHAAFKQSIKKKLYGDAPEATPERSDLSA